MIDKIDRILRHTLEDYRLSRGEKEVLTKVLRQVGADTHDLDVIRSRAFELARHELSAADSAQVLDWLEAVVKTLRHDPSRTESQTVSSVHFSPGDACINAIVGHLRRASKSVDICVFTITDDRISAAIEQAHRQRVAVRIITDDDKSGDLGSDSRRLAGAGIAVRMDRSPYHMHHKFAVLDNRVLINGSFNWTRTASECNEENIVVTDDPRLTQSFAVAFEELWNRFA